MKPFISTRSMHGFESFLSERLGAKLVEGVLNEVDLPSSALETPKLYVPHDRQLEFLDVIARKAGCDNALFVLGEFSSIKSYGLVGDYLCGATTFGEAVRLLVSVMHSHASHDRISFRHSRSGYTCIYHAALRNQKEYPHYATLALTVVLTIAETYFERRYRREISFNFSKPRGTANYEEFFGCNVRFDQPELSIMFDRAAECATRQVHSSSSVNLVDVLDDAFGTPPTSILSAVKSLVQGNLPEHIGVGRIAQQLDLSERTLRRRLEDHGTNFRHLSGNLRVEMAHQLLTLTDLEITEIAHRVGYSDSSHLGRAYRQWTGMPVSQARTPSQTN